MSKSSIYTGRAKSARSVMIKTNIKILELLIQEKESIENQINDFIKTQFEDVLSNIEHIRSISGVSDKTISAIIGECGDLKRFKDVKSFISYLGLYPTQYQSGNSLSIGTLAKREFLLINILFILQYLHLLGTILNLINYFMIKYHLANLKKKY